MKKIVIVAFLALFCMVLPLMANAANLVVNGDFSTAPTVPVDPVAPNAKPVNTWYITNGTGGTGSVPWDFNTGKAVATAAAGSYFLGSNQRMGNLRYITGPIAGLTQYTYSFDYKAQGSGFTGGGYNASGDTSTCQLQVQQYGAAGALGALLVNQGYTALTVATGDTWTHWTATFTTDASAQSIMFKWMVAMGDGNDMPGIEYDQDSFQLDNVSLVPEPGTIFSLLSGFAGMGMMIIRRKRA